MDKRPQACIVAFIIVVASISSVPYVHAMVEGSTVIDSIPPWIVAIPGGYTYDLSTTRDQCTETSTGSSVTLNNVTETSYSTTIIGSGYTMTETGSQNVSSTGSAVYDVLDYINETGTYELVTTASTFNGITSGNLTQNMYSPVGECSFTATPINSTASALSVTLPNGTTIDSVSFWQYVNQWRGSWWNRRNLQGWMISWSSTVAIGIGIIVAAIGLIPGGQVFLGLAGLILALMPIYQATNGYYYVYFDLLLYYGCVLTNAEVGFWTNQFALSTRVWPVNVPPYWWYFPVWDMFGYNGIPHSGVWPPGW
jgi:hypothetical protein